MPVNSTEKFSSSWKVSRVEKTIFLCCNKLSRARKTLLNCWLYAYFDYFWYILINISRMISNFLSCRRADFITCSHLRVKPFADVQKRKRLAKFYTSKRIIRLLFDTYMSSNSLYEPKKNECFCNIFNEFQEAIRRTTQDHRSLTKKWHTNSSCNFHLPWRVNAVCCNGGIEVRNLPNINIH